MFDWQGLLGGAAAGNDPFGLGAQLNMDHVAPQFFQQPATDVRTTPFTPAGSAFNLGLDFTQPNFGMPILGNPYQMTPEGMTSMLPPPTQPEMATPESILPPTLSDEQLSQIGGHFGLYHDPWEGLY